MRPISALFVAATLWALALPLAAQQQGGTPLPDLTAEQRQAFDNGGRAFRRDYSQAEGLGPVFNDESCADCHPAGRASNRTVRRFGRVEGGTFSALEALGGSLVQSRAIGSVTTVDGTHVFRGENVPPQATVNVQRRSQSIAGLGFVDAVPDETWMELAAQQLDTDPSTAGTVQIAFDRVSGRIGVGKFGWKAQAPSLRHFAGDALLNEMGITSPGFRDEICPQGDCLSLGFNPTPALNDDGREADAIAVFMTMLAAPTRGPITAEVTSGEVVFGQIGCATCHRPALRTGPNQVRALDSAVFSPYSDFLLHDMGSLGDGIAQGVATGRQMRTPPLWGLRALTRYLHDGSARSLEDAIRRHDGQGLAARERFDALDDERRAWLLAFLRSL